MKAKRHSHLLHFYEHLDRLERRLGGPRRLDSADGKLAWPLRGVYFFREPGEHRTDTGEGPRVVRVGTHALKTGSKTTLWNRLSQHKGQLKSGGGNHRGSIFRLIVGRALMSRDHLECPSWGYGSSAPKQVKASELAVEQAVSRVVRDMPFLWLGIEDGPGPDSLRGYVERNSIALLSNAGKAALDAPSSGWLGHHCDRRRVRTSGLWNQNHVDEPYDPAFLDTLERLVEKVPEAT